MKILFVSWGIQINDILWGLLELDLQVELYPGTITMQTFKDEEKKALAEYMKGKNYDFLITSNFSRTISAACQRVSVKYVAWLFDSPQIDLYTKEALNEINYIFVFDKEQYKRMRARGIKNLFYQPLAANITRNTLIEITQEDEKRFAGDVTFVGSLYENNHFNQDYVNFSENTRKSLQKAITEKVFRWEAHHTVFETLSEEQYRELSQYAKPWPQYEIELPYFYDLYYVVRKISEVERVCVLNALALAVKVDLYTGSDTYALENVNVHGMVSYNEEVPKIYRLSKINLNMTMRSIESGVPQRIFDIMASGGFVISNYQTELAELFTPDKEIVLFHDIDELVKKVNYYMSHEEERQKIAKRGYEKVCACYQYPQALRNIIDKLDIH